MRIQPYSLIAPAFFLFMCGCGGGTSEPILQAGDYAGVKSETYCMQSQDALAELRSWAVRKDYDEVSRVFRLKGVALVRIGDQVKILDRTFGGDVKIRVSEGRECWTVMNALQKGVAATTSAQTRAEIEGNPISTSQGSPSASVRPIPDGSNPAQTIIGKWISKNSLGAGTVSIYRENDNTYLQINLEIGEGKATKHEVVETRSPRGRRFQYKEPDASGEYYVIDRKGNLQDWDRQGLIETLTKVQ
jgi:hypothetical protein